MRNWSIQLILNHWRLGERLRLKILWSYRWWCGSYKKMIWVVMSKFHEKMFYVIYDMDYVNMMLKTSMLLDKWVRFNLFQWNRWASCPIDTSIEVPWFRQKRLCWNFHAQRISLSINGFIRVQWISYW